MPPSVVVLCEHKVGFAQLAVLEVRLGEHGGRVVAHPVAGNDVHIAAEGAFVEVLFHGISFLEGQGGRGAGSVFPAPLAQQAGDVFFGR